MHKKVWIRLTRGLLEHALKMANREERESEQMREDLECEGAEYFSHGIR